MTLTSEERSSIEQILKTADFQNSITLLRDLLRRHLIGVLGGDWERIHNDYGMYTINCRAKRMGRTLEKLDRLVEAGSNVTGRDFHRRIPDLAAGRLVVVDAGDLFGLAEVVRKGCTEPSFLPPEPPLVQNKVRHGKFSMYNVERFKEQGYSIQEESAGYCSVHFVFRTGEEFFTRFCNEDELRCCRALARSHQIDFDHWHVEVQVRTLMDEAWGETDHFVRYEDPSLRDDPDIQNQFAALSGYLQAANHHVSLIREAARRKGDGLR